LLQYEIDSRKCVERNGYEVINNNSRSIY
jgi:hypothetical protein